MQREEWSEFSGVAGRLVTGSISGGSLISGIVLGLGLLALDWLLALAGAGPVIMALNLIVLSFVLARFAVNGLYGEWSGTIFSAAGGPWTIVGSVALRYMALTFIWYMPLALIGTRLAQPPEGAPITMLPSMMGGMLVFVAINTLCMTVTPPLFLIVSVSLIGTRLAQPPEGAPITMLPSMMGGMLVFVAINTLCMTVTPPLFLIVSVSANNIGDVFSADHWRRVFGGRKDDLFTVYTVYAGALLMVALLSMPIVMLALAATYKLAILVGALSFCLLFGVSVNLLGRLCGFFACGDLGHLAEQPEPAPESEPVTAPVADPRPVAETAAPPVATTPPTPVATTPPTPPPIDPARRPLPDAKAQVDAAIRGFAEDPEAALAALTRLNEDFAPHPLVLQSLALHNYRAGRVEEGVKIATEAIPLCFERGSSYMAAELYREMRQHRSHLGLSLEQQLTIGHTLARMEDYATAAKAYTAVISQDHGEARAAKGLLQVAEKILHERHKPDAAAKVYRYLLQHCASSPLAEYMQSGLEECERQLAAAPSQT
jgi:hypothetical protein